MNIIHVKLLLSGFGFLHCASIFHDTNEGIMLFGSPNVGKTLTAFLSVLKHGYKLISEDITLADDKGLIYSCPNTSTFLRNKYVLNELAKELSYKEVMGLYLSKFFDRIAVISSFSPYAWGKSLVSKLTSILPFKHHAKARFLIFLARARSNTSIVEELNEEDAIRLASFFNRFEFDYSRDPLILAYSLYHPEFHPDKLVGKEQNIITSLIKGCEKLIVIRANSALEFVKQINKILG
jgi:hypothetical protein